MQLEISLIISQIVAFLIMLWILKRFAWKPLQSILQERKQKIIQDFNEAKKQKENAEELKESYKKQLDQIESEAKEKIAAALEEGRKKALHIQEEAQIQAKSILQKAQKDIQNEIVKAQKTLKENLVQTVIAATEQLIHKKFESSDDKKLIGDLVEKL